MRDARRTPVANGPETKRCAIYTRKSTAAGLEQQFNSLDAQYEACASYVARQPGWTLLSERYDDGGFTGANTERPAFQRLLADIDAAKIDVVVVYKVDRLSRSLLDFAKVMERFNTAGTSFVSVTQNFSTADAMGRLTLNMLMSFAEFEREMIGERTRDKIAAARRKGKWTGGCVPLGYTVVDKRLVVDELEAVAVREVFTTYIEQRSTVATARLLNERHRSTKTGRRWTKADVARAIRNPIYGGFMRSNGSLHASEHPAIVDAETFEKARAILEGNGRERGDNGRNPDYFLRGILRCACCGAAFTPASTRKGETEYRYYRCVMRDKQGKGACPSAPLPAAAVEGYVIERLRDAVAEGDLAEEVTAAVKARVASRRKDLAVEKKRLPKEIAALSDDGKRLVGKLGGMKESGRRLVERRLQEVGEQLGRAEKRLTDVQHEAAALDAAEVEAGWVAQCLEQFTEVWDVLTPENRGRLVRAVVERVEVNEAANEVRVVMADLGSAAEPARKEATA